MCGQVQGKTELYDLDGSVLLFYLFDIGDEIAFEHVFDKGLVEATSSYTSPVFKYYRAPISFKMCENSEHEPIPQLYESNTIFNKLYDFGVLSFCYKIPFQGTLESLKTRIGDIKKYFDNKSEQDAKRVFDAIEPALEAPHFYNIKNWYFAIQVNPLQEHINPDEFKKQYGPKIASLLRLETQNLSAYQKDEILSSVTGYYGQDLIIIDSDASFIYDNEYFEALEFIEAAIIERLELEYFDRVLDKRLRSYYQQESYKVPLLAYIPIISGLIDLPISRLTKLQVDISVITDRLKNSIKLSGDAYFAKLYSMLVDKLLLREWRDSIDEKLNIFKDIYTVYQDRIDTVHEEMLTIVIIILIAMEAFMLVK